MVKQEIHKINDFSTPSGQRKLFIGTSSGTHTLGYAKVKKKQTKTMQSKLNTWQFAGSNTKTITPCLSKSSTKISTTASQIVETGARLARVV